MRLIGLAAAVLLLGATGRAALAAPSVSSPSSPQVEAEADRPIRLPSTAYCTETIMSHHVFANSYYSPFKGTFTPPADCPGPWNKVVLTFTASVGGTQFDRTLDISVGGAELLRSSTSEPALAPVSWTVQRDVTQEQALFTTPQPVLVRLDNVNDSTYTGQYDTSATLSFYETGPTAPAPAFPTVIFPLSPLAPAPSSGNTLIDPEFTLNSSTASAGNDVTFPSNLTTLKAEVFADGHGSDEEFWWDEPQQAGSATATPYRAAAVYIDGALAGAAPVFPTVFTGGEGPGFWEPIPSPRAWNLRPDVIDLTPFVATLTDGAPHRIRLGVLDADYTDGGDGYWPIGANLLGTTSTSSARTTGALTAVSAPAAITDTVTQDPVGAAYVDNASHALSFAGFTVDGNGHRVDTAVSESTMMTGEEPQAGADDSWTTDNVSTTTADGHVTKVDHAATFSLLNVVLARFQYTDNRSDSTTVDGVPKFSESTVENMATSGVGLANGVEETEDVGFSDSTGICYHHTLTAAGGQVAGDTTDGMCPGGSATTAYHDPDGTPYAASASAAPALPEAGAPVLFLLVSLLAALWLRRRSLSS